MNIQPIGFVDPSAIAATLFLKHHARFADDTHRQNAPNSPHHDTETIVLRGPEDPWAENWFEDIEQIDYPLMADWVAARIAIASVESEIARNFPQQQLHLGKVMVERLKPGGFVDWHVDAGPYAQAHNRFHLCISPCWGAWLYSGGEGMCMAAGNLFYFNNKLLHSAANFGSVPRINLIVDIRRPPVQ